MDSEIERGRIAGLRVRRLETAEWAKSLIPILAEARAELPEYAGTGEPSRQAYADWLNFRNIPSRNGKGKWSSEKVRRLFDIHIGLMDEAENEFEIEIGIIKYKRRAAGKRGLTLLIEEEKAARENRARSINDAHRLSAELRGQTYIDQTVPDSLGQVKRVRQVQKRVEALQKRQLQSVSYTKLMVPVIEQAGEELGAAASLRAYADWLNKNGHKTLKGKVWRSQTVSELLAIDALLIRQAEAEHERTVELAKLLLDQAIRAGQDAKCASEERTQQVLESGHRLEEQKAEAIELADQFRAMIGNPFAV